MASMRIFNAVKKPLGIGFIVDALFGNFAHLHSLYTAVELHKRLRCVATRSCCSTYRPVHSFQLRAKKITLNGFSNLVFCNFMNQLLIITFGFSDPHI